MPYESERQLFDFRHSPFVPVAVVARFGKRFRNVVNHLTWNGMLGVSLHLETICRSDFDQLGRLLPGLRQKLIQREDTAFAIPA